MNSSPTVKPWLARAVVGFSVFAVVATLLVNGLLVYSVLDGKRLIQKVELEAGRELSGYELYSDYREVNDYYYPDREFQGDLLYFFSETFWAWVVVSLFVSLGTVWNSRQFRVGRLAPSGLMLFLLGMVIVHAKFVEKIAWAVE